MREISPTARALKALEAIQNTPGITAERLGQRLGVTERAARRYVAILREADIPIESVTGPRGGYQVGRGLRLLDAPLADVARWTPRSLGRLEPTTEEGRTRLVATTENADWYARQLAALPMSFEVVGGPELRKAVIALGERLAASGRAGSPLGC